MRTRSNAYPAQIGRPTRWLQRVYDAFDTLQYMPDRYELAKENAGYDYDIYRLLIGSYIAAYTVDESAAVVYLLGFRHGSRLPRPSGNPPN